MHPNNQDIIARLRLGLERSQKRKDEYEAKIREKHENYVKKSGESWRFEEEERKYS